jgi:hypothetical protein
MRLACSKTEERTDPMSEQQKAETDRSDSRSRAEDARVTAQRRDTDRRAWLRARAMTIGPNGR